MRAYPEGEAYGDQGLIVTGEARLTLGRWLSFVPGQLQGIAFVDAARSTTPMIPGSPDATAATAAAPVRA